MSTSKSLSKDACATPAERVKKLSGLVRSFTGSDEPRRIKSNISFETPRTHQLPVYISWAFTLLIPVAVAAVNWLMVVIDTQLRHLKFDVVMQGVMDKTDGPLLGALANAGVAVLYALVSTFLVCSVAPLAAGSGLPEAKGYLNGNPMPEIFTIKSFFARTAGVIFTTAAGFPVGREGPMVCIGGYIGKSITHVLSLPFMRRWVKSDVKRGSTACVALVIHTERFGMVKRIGFVLGACAGIATAFNSPIGGILYMFEEVTVTNWVPELTFRAFVCSVLATLTSRGLMSLFDEEMHTLLIYEGEAKVYGSWNVHDVVFVVIVAAIVGALSALFSRALITCWTFRRSMAYHLRAYQPLAKICEVVLFAAICALVFGLVPSLVKCQASDGYSHSDDHRRLSGLEFSRYTCPEGEYNSVATILLNGGEGAVKHLFARTTVEQKLGHLFLCMVSYFVLACGMPGLAVPMGVFVPSLLIGALTGRFFGEVIQSIEGLDVAHAGIYSMVGSAAMLGGFTHMNIAIVGLLVEAAYDLSLVPVLMLSVSVSTMVSKNINSHGYDEILIMKKGVPYLEPELPHEMEKQGESAGSLMDAFPVDAMLPHHASPEVLHRALKCDTVETFPVFDDDRSCIGLVTRERLESAIKAHTSETEADVHMKRLFYEKRSVTESDLGVPRLIQRLCEDSSKVAETNRVPVLRFMDPVPYTLLEEMPAVRLYPLFASGHVSTAVVISKKGAFRGILTRMDLVNPQHHEHNPEIFRVPSYASSSIHSALDAPISGEHMGPASTGSTYEIKSHVTEEQCTTASTEPFDIEAMATDPVELQHI